MAGSAVTPTSYRDGIRLAYEGELIGESLYRELARRSTDADQQAKLGAIADVERLTHHRLREIAVRLGVTPLKAEWQRVVERRAHELAALSWPQFIQRALREWPPYVAEFTALRRLAPVGDEERIQWLVEHEVVLVEFARLEHADMGSGSSLKLLRGFLAGPAQG